MDYTITNIEYLANGNILYYNTVCKTDIDNHGTIWFLNGDIKYFYFKKFDKPHRKNGPANGYYTGSYIKNINYIINGEKHRENGPAVIDYSDSIPQQLYWFINGELHNETGPAYIMYDIENGNILELEWFIKYVRHRINKPAKISYHEGNINEMIWYVNEGYHREDGPAYILYNTEKNEIHTAKWWLNNIEYRYDDFVKNPSYQAYLKKESTTIFD